MNVLNFCQKQSSKVNKRGKLTTNMMVNIFNVQRGIKIDNENTKISNKQTLS